LAGAVGGATVGCGAGGGVACGGATAGAGEGAGAEVAGVFGPHAAKVKMTPEASVTINARDPAVSMVPGLIVWTP
jgi:hypothetical protein